MDNTDWNLKYATAFTDQYGTKIEFNPTHSGNIGSMMTYYTDGRKVSGEYTLRFKGDIVYLKLGNGDEYLFSPTDDGFNLIVVEAVAYRFARSIE